MRRVFISLFPSLDNYGTGMMGINTLHYLNKCMDGKVAFVIPFDSDFRKADLFSELGSTNIQLEAAPKSGGRPFWRKATSVFTGSDVSCHDGLVILGGDNLSEYYGSIWRGLLVLAVWSKHKPTFLLGQSMGPFTQWQSRFIVRYLMRRCHIFAREAWTVEYLKNEYNLTQNVYPSADLAFLDLPMQRDATLWSEVAKKYRLEPNQYFTVVLSALSGKYVDNRAVYLKKWREIITALANNQQLINKKICLLAHTFGPSGDEGSLIRDFAGTCEHALRERFILITEKILPTRARLVLGNGLFTITGRMHAAVSTFQMGKPAISLAYSKKYDGVIGQNLGRSDLVLDAREQIAWLDGSMCSKILDRVNYVIARRDELNEAIEKAILDQKCLALSAIERVAHILSNQRVNYKTI